MAKTSPKPGDAMPVVAICFSTFINADKDSLLSYL